MQPALLLHKVLLALSSVVSRTTFSSLPLEGSESDGQEKTRYLVWSGWRYAVLQRQLQEVYQRSATSAKRVRNHAGKSRPATAPRGFIAPGPTAVCGTSGEMVRRIEALVGLRRILRMRCENRTQRRSGLNSISIAEQNQAILRFDPPCREFQDTFLDICLAIRSKGGFRSEGGQRERDWQSGFANLTAIAICQAFAAYRPSQ